MELAQVRIVSHDVEQIAGFYAALLDVPVALNEYYVEIPAGAATIGFSRHRFTECDAPARAGDGCSGTVAVAPSAAAGAQLILDFEVRDVDLEFARVDQLGVEWVMKPRTQPWGNRSMIFRDPVGALVNVFARPAPAESAEP
jgi:predicted enzyme related to lactoylglutathione lyase